MPSAAATILPSTSFWELPVRKQFCGLSGNYSILTYCNLTAVIILLIRHICKAMGRSRIHRHDQHTICKRNKKKRFKSGLDYWSCYRSPETLWHQVALGSLRRAKRAMAQRSHYQSRDAQDSQQYKMKPLWTQIQGLWRVNSWGHLEPWKREEFKSLSTKVCRSQT